MADYDSTDQGAHIQPFPDNPGLAVAMATIHRRLGGTLSISSRGDRYIGHSECMRLTHPDGMPQMHGALPHQQFHSEAEWLGAIKLVEFMIGLLSPADKDLVFTAAASVCIDSRKNFDFREHLK